MSRLMSRGAILTASRLSNFAIVMLSPLLVVRILDIASYGRLQEFMIYATLLVSICGFRIDASLTYFLPRYPKYERQFASQTTALVLIFSSVCITFLIVARKLILEITSYDFVSPLAAYVFCFVNLNWLEFFWIAKRRTDLVLYYSAVRLIMRVTVLVLVAYLTQDVETILWSLVALEALRLALVATYLFSANLLTFALNWAHTKEQLRFAGPVGLAGLMQQASRDIGKLFIGSVLGPIALAYYSVASYLLPAVRVMISSIIDVIFPEMVRARDDGQSALRLWQRSNIVFCFLLFPPFVLLIYYAELFVTTLFTDEYLPAVPVFQVYALWLLRRCFSMDVLLRTRGRTTFMLFGTGLSIVINLALMVLLYRSFGLIGPAVAYLAGEICLECYYASRVKKEFGLTTAKLVDWKSILRVCAGCVAGVPLLIIADQIPGPEPIRAATASLTYVIVSWLVAYRLGVIDIGRVVGFALSSVRRPTPPI